MLESKIERHLIDRVREMGGATRKLRWACRRGAPDRLVMLPGMPARVALVELKQQGKKLQPHQQREHSILREYFDVVTLDSIEAIDKWLDKL